MRLSPAMWLTALEFMENTLFMVEEVVLPSAGVKEKEEKDKQDKKNER